MKRVREICDRLGWSIRVFSPKGDSSQWFVKVHAGRAVIQAHAPSEAEAWERIEEAIEILFSSMLEQHNISENDE